ncbi:MAG: aldehyde dehydrogenase family protein [Planctomycetes bacterium]|nr:aldehyde dehydrogenase family protein [Planctomycetota bacterium]
MHSELLRIGGERRRGVATDLVRSPYDGRDVGSVQRAGREQLEAALARAERGFDEMRALPAHRRATILANVAHGLRAQAEELARTIAAEAGKPLRFARAEVSRAVVTFELAASSVRQSNGEVLPLDLEPRGEGRLCVATRVPRGPVIAITPFNFPLNLVAHKLAPAFAIGASVILKPAPQTPLTAFRLSELLDAAGLPGDALSIVPCEPADAELLVRDERAKVLSFTGSDRVGWHLKAIAGKKQVLLELGGNAPCILDEGVELAPLVEPLLLSAFGYAGQVCVKAQRFFVHESLCARFVADFAAGARALTCGDPLEERTVVGPLIDERAVARVQEWIAEARTAGAVLHCGGEAERAVLRPALLSGVPAEAKLSCEEIFGPVAIVEPFARFEDALARANATRFGLQASVFTPRLDHALLAHRALDYGAVLVNEVPSFRIDNFPYGGAKDSGFGREGVRYAMDAMSEWKTLVLARG